ncbi:putative membrane protein [Clostridium bornimense]|uniref:Putative membrane protein n=1 Tax=Clostridium bornimense TaxID=1216932 RepID=W6RVW9_9CLOT|nr:prepilin-type N-terminal cleavage/methylation domain-containing protein [Clostridium bornimense]CDM68498.1 putative membrane protein [Clostridium bornimense]
MNNLTKKRKKKGFTLVELMAVVAIIAILAVVLVPTVSGYINRSKKVAIISQVRIALGAVETYNATASTTIDDGTTVTDAVTTIDDEDIIVSEDVDRIGSMTIGQARKINKDSDAIKNITLDGTNFSTYTEPASE